MRTDVKGLRSISIRKVFPQREKVASVKAKGFIKQLLVQGWLERVSVQIVIDGVTLNAHKLFYNEDTNDTYQRFVIENVRFTEKIEIIVDRLHDYYTTVRLLYYLDE